MARKNKCFLVTAIITVPVIAKSEAEAIKLVKADHEKHVLTEFDMVVRKDATSEASSSKEFATFLKKANGEPLRPVGDDVSVVLSGGEATTLSSISTAMMLSDVFVKGKDPRRHPGLDLPEATPST